MYLSASSVMKFYTLCTYAFDPAINLELMYLMFDVPIKRTLALWNFFQIFPSEPRSYFPIFESYSSGLTVLFVQSVFVWCWVFASHHGSLVDWTNWTLLYSSCSLQISYLRLVLCFSWSASCKFLESTISSSVTTSLFSCTIRFSAQSTLFCKIKLWRSSLDFSIFFSRTELLRKDWSSSHFFLLCLAYFVERLPHPLFCLVYSECYTLFIDELCLSIASLCLLWEIWLCFHFHDIIIMLGTGFFNHLCKSTF